jgi:hypothetical protein
MSIRKAFGIAMLCVVGAMSPVAAEAQLPFSDMPSIRPSVSPYLNLLRNTGGGTSNYFTLVRPQLQAREALQRQQAQINQVQRQAQRGQPGGVPVRGSQEIRGTGHETAFMNYLHYYPIRAR